MSREIFRLATPVNRTGKLVAVILGDPSLPDKVKIGGAFGADDLFSISRLKAELATLSEYEFVYLDHHDTLLFKLINLRPELTLAFNLCDNGFRNDPRRECDIPAMLGILGIPYTGAAPGCLHTCYDKRTTKLVAESMGIHVPRGWTVEGNDVRTLNGIEATPARPMIVKPAQADNSVGITQRSVAHDDASLMAAIASARSVCDGPLIVEEFLPGADCTVSLLQGQRGIWKPLAIGEDVYDDLPPDLPPICGYEAKWDTSSPYAKIRTREAEISPDVAAKMLTDSERIVKRLECRDYARVDWRLDGIDEAHMLEVNPNPGWVWDSHWVKAAALSGMDYPAALRAILTAAENRIKG